ncbi:hypothetical protein SRB521_00658 [Intestinimonas butyriciproducens]|nr:hypothetical protein SRB521_00658 [Intestinimonas butyriciproducens]
MSKRESQNKTYTILCCKYAKNDNKLHKKRILYKRKKLV